MGQYLVNIKNNKGQTEKLTVQGDSEQEVSLRMRDLGHFVIQVEPQGSHPTLSRAWRKSKFRQDDVLMFTRLLATIVRANIPIVTGLEIISKQMQSQKFLKMIQDINQSLREGLSLSESMEKFPSAFNDLYLNMIRAGEITGKMADIIANLFQYLKKSYGLRKKVIASLLYPVIIFSISIAIASFFIFFLIPEVEQMFSSFDAEMPTITVVVLDVSRFFRNHSLALALAILTFIFLFSLFKRTNRGAYILDSLSLKIPVIGELLVKIYMVRFSYTFAVLYGNEVAILEALRIVSGAMGNRYYSRAIAKAAEEIEVGSKIEDAFAARQVFPDIIIQMLSIGEASRRVDEMLMEIATFYDNEVDVALETLTGVIQPLAIVFLGVFIAVTLLALFLPIFNLSGIVQ